MRKHDTQNLLNGNLFFGWWCGSSGGRLPKKSLVRVVPLGGFHSRVMSQVSQQLYTLK